MLESILGTEILNISHGIQNKTIPGILHFPPNTILTYCSSPTLHPQTPFPFLIPPHYHFLSFPLSPLLSAYPHESLSLCFSLERRYNHSRLVITLLLKLRKNTKTYFFSFWNVKSYLISNKKWVYVSLSMSIIFKPIETLWNPNFYSSKSYRRDGWK